MQLFHCQSSVLVSLRCHHECVGKSEPEPNNQILSVTKERCISVQALTLLLAVTVNTVSSIPTYPLAHRGPTTANEINETGDMLNRNFVGIMIN